MKHPGLVAFSLTTFILVPAAIHHLTAGREQIEKMVAPDNSTLKLDTATVAVSLDRYMLDPKDRLNIHLAATEASGKKLELAVLVLGANGSEMSRVPTPPNKVAYRTITLDVVDGVASGDVSIALQGAMQNQYEPFGHYTVLVGPPKALAKLDRLRAKAGYLGGGDDEDEGIPSLNRSGERFMTMYYEIQGDDRALAITESDVADVKDDREASAEYTRGTIARLEAHTRPVTSAVSLAVPDTTKVGEDFTVQVRVTNPGRNAMKGLKVSLAEHMGFNLEYVESPAQHIAIARDAEVIDLGPKETRQIAFTVKANTTGVVGLYAQATCTYDSDDEKACVDVQALALGAFDATEIREATPSTVVIR